MTVVELFLREHGEVHRRQVGGSPFGVDWLLKDLDDAAWRARPYGFNSPVWLLWHIATVEDTHVAPVVFGAPPLLDDARAVRLCVSTGRAYTGPDEVDVLTSSVNIGELLAYRDEVGARTRELAARQADSRWTAPVDESDLRRGTAAGHLTGDETHLLGTPRDALLHWWAISHSTYHLGQLAMLRRALGLPAG